MPRDQERRRKKLERKAAKRKERAKALVRSEIAAAPPSPRALLRAAVGWPLEECWISRDWQQEGELVQVVVTRRSPTGLLGAAVFLVDLGLLGVKNAFARVFEIRRDYEELIERLDEQTPLVKTDLNLVAKVIREAIAYARQFGFSPHRDYVEAAPFLEGAEPDASPARVPLGKDGKPFFVAGPYDNVPRIIAQLVRKVGEGNFHYIVPLDPGASLEVEQIDAEGAGDEERPGSASSAIWRLFHEVTGRMR